MPGTPCGQHTVLQVLVEALGAAGSPGSDGQGHVLGLVLVHGGELWGQLAEGTQVCSFLGEMQGHSSARRLAES